MRVLTRIHTFLASSRRRWVLLAAVAVLIVVVLGRDDLGHMGRSVLAADWRWALVALGLMLFSLWMRSAALTAIVRAASTTGVRVRDAFSSTSIGLLANAVVPVRLGALLNPYVLYLLLRRRGYGVPFVTAFGMTVTEQLFSALTFVVLSLVFVSTLSAPVWATPALIVCGVLLGLGLAGATAMQFHRVRRRATGYLADAAKDGAKPGWRGRLHSVLPHFVDSQRVLARPSRALLVVGVQTAAWLVQLAAAVAVLHAFHLGGAGWRAAALVLILTNLIGILPLTPGNLGTFQLAATAALAASGVAPGPALAFALGLQAMQLLVGVTAGLVSLSVQGMSLADLAGRGRHAAELLRQQRPAPTRVDPAASG
jgi:uncharacterized protein (TIRG00374 family)